MLFTLIQFSNSKITYFMYYYFIIVIEVFNFIKIFDFILIYFLN
jgi:hypothetical protein